MCCPPLQGVPQLALCLSEEPEHHIKAATVWSINQLGHHTPEHAKAVAISSLIPKLLQLYMDANSSEDLQAKVKCVVLKSAGQCWSIIRFEGRMSKQNFTINLCFILVLFARVRRH